MAKKVVFSDLPISQWQAGDTVAVFRNGKVVRIPVFGQGDIPEFPKLATVATSGKYSDLTGRPVLGTAASKNEGDFATAEQGSKGVTAFSWGNHSEAGYALAASVTQGLSQKVDKQPGYGLSQQNFTLVEKQKLAGLESSRYKGLFPTVSALNTGVISPSAGDYADVDAGSGSDVQRYIWDDSDQKWIAQSGAVPPITAAQVKGLYESNPDTNAFTNQQKADLESVFSWGDHRVQGYVLSTDGRLSNAREWTASTVSQSEAETGTATTARKWTAQRVRQAVLAWWAGSDDKAKLDGVAVGATKNATDVQLRDRSTHTGMQAISTVSGLQTALDGKVDNSDSRLTNSREWTGATVSQAEAEAGTDTTRRAWTAQRVRQAIEAWWLSIGASFGKGLLNAPDASSAKTSLGLHSVASSGNYNELSNRPASMTQAEANAGSSTTARLITPKVLVDTISDAVSGGVSADALIKANNLSDLPNKTTARNNLGLGSAATRNVGTGFGNVMEVGAFGVGSSLLFSPTVTLASQHINGFGSASHGNTAPPDGPDGVIGKVLYIGPSSWGSQMWFSYGLGKVFFRNRRTGEGYESWKEFFHTGNFNPDEKANTTTQVIAGNGLSGGGNLSANRILTLGTPSTLTKTSTNSVSATSHTHELGADVKASLAKADSALQNGAYGLGERLPIKVFDANLIADEVEGSTGLYPYLSKVGSTNVPHTYVYIFQLFYNSGANNCTQIAFGYNKSRSWIRFRYGNVWSPWQEHLVPESLLTSTGNSAQYPMTQKAVTDALNLKQDKLIVGTNISISGSTISATDTTYTLGTLAQLNAGTDTVGRLQSAKNLADWLNSKGYVTTDTKYSAGNGLTLSGTTFSLPVTVSGSGTYVQSVVQSANGIEVTLGTPPNTTYSAVSQAEAEAGTATTSRLWSAQRVRQSNAAYTYSKAEIDTKINAVDHSALTLAQAQAAAFYF